MNLQNQIYITVYS